MSLVALIAVGLGGSAGALARSIVGPALQKRVKGDFPWGTLAINAVACFAAGAILETQLGGILGLALTMGFLGGFSTLSTVVFESIEFAFNGKAIKGIANLVATYAIAVVAAASGFAAAGLLL